jgi:hypothetical protein
MNNKKNLSLLLSCFMVFSVFSQTSSRWTEEKANEWYGKQPWFVGCNYIPVNSINQMEMWQAKTFDTVTIDKELELASSIGMNTIRVFLHDLLYQQDPSGFLKRIDIFLKIADKHKIKVMLVFFDSCWDPYPYLGKQRDPKPGVHNSGWVQSPGVHALRDKTEDKRLEKYVKAVVKRFAKDERIFCWDVWNEPDNRNSNSYSDYEPQNKAELVVRLMKNVYCWVRSQNPVQPLTSGIWVDLNSKNVYIQAILKLQIEQSDILSFHSYSEAESFEKFVNKLGEYNRPLICTEFLARGNNSTFETILPVAKKYKVGAMCWGLVDGKTNTIHNWGTWQNPDKTEPKVWHHDVFRKDHTPYSQNEIDFIKKITGKE